MTRRFRESASLALRLAAVTVALFLAARPWAAGAAEDAPVAEVDGQAITAEELEKALGSQLTRLEEQIYTLKRQKLEALIDERLLAREAARRGVSVAALMAAEVTAKAGPVTEQEVEAFYLANKARLRGEASSVRERIRAHLQGRKLAEQRAVFTRGLRSQAQVVVRLTIPAAARVALPIDGTRALGPEGAPVTIVKFEDFHCPFCRESLATIGQLRSRYGDKVRVLHRDFPIESLHPGARAAHEASRCADEQGKFWPYHDLLYARPPTSRAEDLAAFAGELGLDAPAFRQCLASGKYRPGVQGDVDAGTRAGVTGTPTFFINGRLLSGAQPIESFVRVIDAELAGAR